MLKQIYNFSPMWFQNIMLSIYSERSSKKRYPDNIDQIIFEKQKIEMLPREKIEELNTFMLETILKYSSENVEYYTRVFKKNNFTFNTNVNEEVKKISFLNKEIIINNYKELISKEFQIKDLIKDSTSGTTGTPLKIYKDINTYRESFITWEVLRRNNGVKIGDKRATFFGREIVSMNEKNNFWRYNAYQNQLLFSIFHIKNENVINYVKKLNQFKPIFIESYPSAIYILAKMVKEQGLELKFQTKCIFTTAENLEPYMREVIEDIFKTKVIDQYGSSESVLFSSECEKGNKHIFPGFGHSEVLKNDGTTSEVGYGELVVTGLFNKSMPFIRYKTGDIVELAYKKCSCGRQSKIITRIDGRKEDIITTPDGRQIGRLDHIFKGLKNIKEAQIIQESLDEIIIKVVPGIGYSKKSENEFINALKFRLGNKFNYRIELVEKIPREKNGKLRAVISKVRKV